MTISLIIWDGREQTLCQKTSIGNKQGQVLTTMFDKDKHKNKSIGFNREDLTFRYLVNACM